MRELSGRVRAAVQKYDMIPAQSRVAVGVSGGKDSLFLLAALADLRRYYPQPFELLAITADPCFGGAETDFSAVASFCASLGVPYHVRRTELGKIVFEDRREENPCALCARMRRGILHKLCGELGCTHLALGHHMDDAAQTVLMNLLYGGRFGCFSPKSYLSRRGLWLIRPLIFCPESEIRRAASRLALPVVKSACPADGHTARRATADRIAALEKDFPDLTAKLVGALQRSHTDNW